MAASSGVTLAVVLGVVFREMLGVMLSNMLFAVMFPLPGLGSRGERKGDGGNGEDEQEFFHGDKDWSDCEEVTAVNEADQQGQPYQPIKYR